MIAIIDSGSTKADWVFADDKNCFSLNSDGMNPSLIDEEEITGIINDQILKSVSADKVEHVYYYGTGCSEVTQIEIVKNAFQQVFVNAKVIVRSDILGAVIATCGDDSGIACILGTGCNSVYYDGKNIVPNNYGLGYILSDEGAGTYLGKKIITNYLYGLLPEKLSTDFKNKYNLTREEVINKTYNNKFASKWIASFAEFYLSHEDDEWIRKTIRKGFEKFINKFVMHYDNYENTPVHFVGSISYLHREILKRVAEEKGIKPGKIIHKPIDGLVDYYTSKNK